MAVFLGWCSTAPLLFDKDFGGKERAHVVGVFYRYPHLKRFNALVACRGVKVKAVSAGMQISSAIAAFVGDLNLLRDLNFGSAVITARNHVKSSFYTAAGSFNPRWRFRSRFALSVLITGLTILSAHFPPYRDVWRPEAAIIQNQSHWENCVTLIRIAASSQLSLSRSISTVHVKLERVPVLSAEFMTGFMLARAMPRTARYFHLRMPVVL
jgi:hypothetical protein